jgi:hypothetical protein
METPRSTLFTAEIDLTAATALTMEDIKAYYVDKYALSLERMTLSQSVDLLQVICVCKFGKRQKLYLRTVTETINGQQVQAATKHFASQHQKGEFDILWKKVVTQVSDPRNRVTIWSSAEYQNKHPIQKIAEMEDLNGALMEMYLKDPKKAIGSGLASNQKNFKVIKEVLHANSLPVFEWSYPEHLLSPDTCYLPQEELNHLRRWFIKECEPEHKERRKALVLFSKGREYGKSTFARSLVSGMEEFYIEIGGVSMTEKNFACKTKARLFIIDDMEIDLRKSLEMWKKLLSSQRVNLRDCYFNQEFPGGIPVIVTTNNDKLFYQLAKSSLFKDQCYFLSLSEFMGPLNCKPSALQDDEETKRREYHCGPHLAQLSPIIIRATAEQVEQDNRQEAPFGLNENSNDSERFKSAIHGIEQEVKAIKHEECSSSYKGSSEEEKQVFLHRFAELRAELRTEIEKIKSMYSIHQQQLQLQLQQQQPQPAQTINVFNFLGANDQSLPSGEISYNKGNVPHRRRQQRENSPSAAGAENNDEEEDDERLLSPTLRKMQFQWPSEEVPPKNLVGAAPKTREKKEEATSAAMRSSSNSRVNNLYSTIPGVTFDGYQLPKVIAGMTELVSDLKLRRLLTWTNKRIVTEEEEEEPSLPVPEDEEEMKSEETGMDLNNNLMMTTMKKNGDGATTTIIPTPPTTNSEDVVVARDRRQSFSFFHSYLLSAKKTDIKINKPEEQLLAVETCYFPAARMKRSTSKLLFGRVYGAASYQTVVVGENSKKKTTKATTTTPKLTGTMQTFEKSRRAYLCEDLYWDLDQINSHPSLFISLLEHLHLKVPQLLKEYIEDRDGVLEQIKTSYGTNDKGTAKNLMLRLIYGGTVKNWVTDHQLLDRPSDDFLDQKLEWFANDLSLLNQKLQKLSLFADVRKVYESTYGEAERKKTSFLSLICGEYERQVLMFVRKWLSLQKSPPRHLDVLIHDGGLLRRLPEETEPPQQLLLDLNQELQRVFKTSHIRYAYKKFDNVLATEIDNEEPYYF